MSDVKILAAYLPQYHEIEENNKWWGKGYTDWVAVKKATPQFQGHEQPRIPLDENYYRLDCVDSIRWQVDIANKYGIYGFAIYHYWFSSSQHLLKKPAEIIYINKDIDIHYFFVWDNNSWVNKTWKNVKFINEWAPQFENESSPSTGGNGILAELIYGDETEWDKHYGYLRSHFKDDRYIKIDNCPLFGIFASNNNKALLKKMCDHLDRRAKADGFGGIVFISAATFSRSKINMSFRYEPFNVCTVVDYFERKIRLKRSTEIKRYTYDRVWKKILFNAYFIREKSTILGAFVRYDDTPRRGAKASVITGETPEKFCDYMKKLLKISKKQKKRFIYLTAWNEWGEGAYLEPDDKDRYAYLKALKEAIDTYGD